VPPPLSRCAFGSRQKDEKSRPSTKQALPIRACLLKRRQDACQNGGVITLATFSLIGIAALRNCEFSFHPQGKGRILTQSILWGSNATRAIILEEGESAGLKWNKSNGRQYSGLYTKMVSP